MTKMGEAKEYKKYLRGMRRATSSQFPANAFTAGKTALGKAQLQSHLKTKLPKEASTLKKAAQAAKATRYGKIALGVAGAGLAAREWLKHKSKQHKAKKKKHSVGALVIGLGAKKMKDKGKNVLPLGGAAALLLGKKKKEMLGKRLGGRANLLEEMGRIDARSHPDAADRAEKRRVIGELNRGYKKGKSIRVKCKLAKTKPTKLY
jgi:hypothetical protein